jgi:hypothetical protein
LESFCEAVRAKKKWYHKILDEEQDLGMKWAQEAGYLQPDGSGVVGGVVIDAIECVSCFVCFLDEQSVDRSHQTGSSRAKQSASVSSITQELHTILGLIEELTTSKSMQMCWML